MGRIPDKVRALVSVGRFTILRLGLVTALLGCAPLFLATAVAQWDAAERAHHYLYLLVIAMLGLTCGRRWRGHLNRPDKVLFWLALLLPCYAAFQSIPLPGAAIQFLSPARAELLAALGPVGLMPRWAPLAVAPVAAVTHLFLITGYMLVFFLGWQYAWDLRGRIWLAAAPILIAAVVQAGFGLSQALATPDGFAHGAYPVRNHFAGFMELAFPFAVAYVAAEVALARRGGPVSFAAVIRLCAGCAVAFLILLAAMYSLSRMALLACLATLVTMGALAASNGARGLLAVATLALVGSVLFAFMAPPELIARFSDQLSSGRVPVWRDTLHLVRAYPTFGCGLGGYESAYLKFKTWGPQFDQDYAHNDYLQFLAELGVAGFSIGAAFGIALLLRVYRAVRTFSDPNRRWLALACAGSLAAILVHSVADFNLYVPANATLLAWICGLAAAQSERVAPDGPNLAVNLAAFRSSSGLRKS